MNFRLQSKTTSFVVLVEFSPYASLVLTCTTRLVDKLNFVETCETVCIDPLVLLVLVYTSHNKAMGLTKISVLLNIQLSPVHVPASQGKDCLRITCYR